MSKHFEHSDVSVIYNKNSIPNAFNTILISPNNELLCL